MNVFQFYRYVRGGTKAARPIPLTAPVVSGTLKVGSTLSATDGTWLGAPTSYAYQWRRDGASITGATSSTYTLTGSDDGAVISCRVTATNAGGDTANNSNNTSAITYTAPANTVAPSITGLSSPSGILTLADIGTWTGTVMTLSYQWMANGVAISGQTGGTLTKTEAMIGQVIKCRVTATNSGGSVYADSNTITINAVAVLENVTTPAITGTQTQGQTLTVVSGTWSEVSVLTYQWRRDGVAVDGATASTYVLASGDVGKVIDVVETATAGESVGTATSNVTSAIAPIIGGATYDFSGASGTKLSSLGWSLATPSGNGDPFELNGSSQLKKNASTGTSGILYLETGKGAKTQSISGTYLNTTNYLLGVLCRYNGGIEGYLLRKNSTTGYRLSRYVAGAATSLIASVSAGSGVITLEAVVSSDDSSVLLTVYEDGVSKGTYTDTSASRFNRGRVGLCSITTSASNPIFDNVTTYSTRVVGGSGVAQDITYRVGRATPALNGGLPLISKSLGLLVSGEVGSWELTKLSGSSKWPTSVITGNLPTPSSDLTSVADAGTSAVYAILMDDVDSGKTITINVQGAGESEDALTVATQTDIGRLPKASLGGKIVEFMDGCRDSFPASTAHGAHSPATFSGFNTHTGTFKIKRPPGSTKSIACLYITNSTNILVQGLRIDGYISTPWPGEGGKIYGVLNDTTWSNIQNNPILRIDRAQGDVSNITVTQCVIGAPSDITNVTQWLSGVNVSGSTGGTKASNITFGASTSDTETWTPNWASLMADIPPLSAGNVVRRVKDGLTGGDTLNATFRGNIIRDFCSNGQFFGGGQTTNLTLWDQLVVDGWQNIADVGDHPDTCQIGSSNTTGDWDGLNMQRLILALVSSDGDNQGVFMNDVGFSGALQYVNGPPVYSGPNLNSSTQYLSGYRFTNTVIRNIFVYLYAGQNFLLDIGDNYDVRNITLMRPEASSLASGNHYDPQMAGVDKYETASPSIHHYAAGTVVRSAAHGFSGHAALTYTNCVNYGATGLANPPSQNETSRRTFYSTWFSDPGNADVIARGRPILNGPLKVSGDGSYIGCFNPDGSWATGAAYP